MNQTEKDMRGLVDLAFIIQDYETTYDNIKYPLDEFKRIGASGHHASLEEIKFYTKLAWERNISARDIQDSARKILSIFRENQREPLQQIRFVLLITELLTELGHRGMSAEFFLEIAHTGTGIIRPLFFEQAA